MQQCTTLVSTWVCCRLHFLGCKGALKHLHKDEITRDTFSYPIPDLKGLHPAAQPYLNPATPTPMGWATRRLPSLSSTCFAQNTGCFCESLFLLSQRPQCVPRLPRKRGRGVSEGGAREQSSRGDGDNKVVQKVGNQETRPGGVIAPRCDSLLCICMCL